MKNYFTLPKSVSIRWWEKIVLFFIPEYVAIDSGSNDKNCAIFYKMFKGKIYVVREETLPLLQITKRRNK